MSQNWQEKLQEQLEKLPDEPGVYLMYDEADAIIYVGKASSLKQRVRSYFVRGNKNTPKTAALVEKVRRLETVVLNSPVEALVLESNLIKKHHPRYNVRLRDDKQYPYLMLTMAEDFPRLLVVRQPRADANLYFGPYVSAQNMHEVQNIIRQIWPLRSCSNSQFASSKRPCLNHDIGHCLAPCTGGIDKAAYKEMAEEVSLFLEGRTKEIGQNLEKKMKEASAAWHFEEAARYRDQLAAVKFVQQKNPINKINAGDYDIIALASHQKDALAQVFFVRQGKLLGKEHLFLVNETEVKEADLMGAFLPQYYARRQHIPPLICLSALPENTETMALLLQQMRGGSVKITLPQKGTKKSLLKLAIKNACLLLSQNLEANEEQQKRRAATLLELVEILNLPKTPYRIECFDNSHIQGTNTVSAMVVFEGGQAKKSDYRHFRLKGDHHGDDYAAMREVLARRFAKAVEKSGPDEKTPAQTEAKNPKKPAWQELPDLLLVDGGKGQVNVAVEVLTMLDLLAAVPIAGLAETEEYIYLPGERNPIVLPQESPALQLLQQIRDEAHRFALSYHQKLRGKNMAASSLAEISGIGKKRQQALWQHFGSKEKMAKASIEELSLLPGMNKKAATAVYEKLHDIHDKTKE